MRKVPVTFEVPDEPRGPEAVAEAVRQIDALLREGGWNDPDHPTIRGQVRSHLLGRNHRRDLDSPAHGVPGPARR